MFLRGRLSSPNMSQARTLPSRNLNQAERKIHTREKFHSHWASLTLTKQNLKKFFNVLPAIPLADIDWRGTVWSGGQRDLMNRVLQDENASLKDIHKAMLEISKDPYLKPNDKFYDSELREWIDCSLQYFEKADLTQKTESISDSQFHKKESPGSLLTDFKLMTLFSSSTLLFQYECVQSNQPCLSAKEQLTKFKKIINEFFPNALARALYLQRAENTSMGSVLRDIVIDMANPDSASFKLRSAICIANQIILFDKKEAGTAFAAIADRITSHLIQKTYMIPTANSTATIEDAEQLLAKALELHPNVTKLGMGWGHKLEESIEFYKRKYGESTNKRNCM